MILLFLSDLLAMVDVPSLRIDQETGNELTAVQQRQGLLIGSVGEGVRPLFDTHGLPESVGRKNCENWVGSVSVPVGIAGPVSFSFNNKNHTAYVPLATTEGALVASVSRGCKALSQSKTTIFVENRGVSRAPVFRCKSTTQCQELVALLSHAEVEIRAVVSKTSSHCKYLGFNAWIRGRKVYTRLLFDTDQAMGMNMVTISSQAIGEWVVSKLPGVVLGAVSSNVCGDKKESALTAILGRGSWVQAESFVTKETLKKIFKVELEELLETYQEKILIGSSVAGIGSQQAHTANVLAALYIATGQDPAHVVGGSAAFLSMEKELDGLYVALTLPSVMVGVIGGGTYLPAQTAARTVMGVGKKVSKEYLAAVAGVSALAGELSLLASLSTHTLACSHQKLGRIA